MLMRAMQDSNRGGNDEIVPTSVVQLEEGHVADSACGVVGGGRTGSCTVKSIWEVGSCGCEKIWYT